MNPNISDDEYIQTHKWVEILYLSLLILTTILVPLLMYLNIQKQRDIKNPQNNTSYSIITILMLQTNFL